MRSRSPHRKRKTHEAQLQINTMLKDEIEKILILKKDQKKEIKRMRSKIDLKTK
jgi:hypothetical protein